MLIEPMISFLTSQKNPAEAAKQIQLENKEIHKYISKLLQDTPYTLEI